MAKSFVCDSTIPSNINGVKIRRFSISSLAANGVCHSCVCLRSTYKSYYQCSHCIFVFLMLLFSDSCCTFVIANFDSINVLILTPLTLSPPIRLRLYTLPYWSNPPVLISDIQAVWHSVLSARVPECQKFKMVG